MPYARSETSPPNWSTVERGPPVPEVSRRTVMTTGLGGLGLAAVAIATQTAPALAGSPAPAAVNPHALESGAEPTRSLYLPAVGRTFAASDGTRTIDITLTAVEDLPAAKAPGDEGRFSLLFAAIGFLAGDGIFTLRRTGTPTTTLFLTPVGPRGATRTMQAIVNRTV